MPGNRKHHTEKWHSCVDKVMKSGKDESSASAICTTSLQDSGQEIFVAEAARHFHLRGALGAAQTTTWKGKEHLVVPCVALMEGVIHAVNATTPEYVPFEALSKSVDKWNGHPLVVGHPVRDGKQISAYDPKVLDKHCGFIRNAHVNGKRLGFEVLVDPERLTTLKHDQLLADLRAGKEIEVSVGAFVSANDKKSTHNGKAYDGEWMDIFPDHFALLPGGRGACSLEMGCGAHRAASCVVTEEDFKALGVFDTPSQAASEEAAELVLYNSMRTLLDSVGDHWDEASGLLDELIAAEEEDPTESASEEEAETELEDAKLTAIRMLCYSMSSTLQNIVGSSYPKVAPSDPRYMETLRTAIGKKISAANMKIVQSAHDASHDTHTQTVILGAKCDAEMKGLGGPGSGWTAEGGHVPGGSASPHEVRKAVGALHAIATGDDGAFSNGPADRTKLAAVLSKVPVAQVEKLARIEAQAIARGQEDDEKLQPRVEEGVYKDIMSAYKEVVTRRSAAKVKTTDCTSCKGTGSKDGNPCEACDGSGQVPAVKAAESIRHEGGKWLLYSKNSARILGVHGTKEEAEAQEQAIARSLARQKVG